MRETWVRSLGWEDPLENGMAAHSSILAWRIPQTEEPVSYSPWGHSELDTTERLTHTHAVTRALWVLLIGASQVALVVKNLPANARDQMWVPSLSWEDPLEEGMATHSSIFAWRIPWTEEPDGLQSTRLQRVDQDRNNLVHTLTYPHLYNGMWFSNKKEILTHATTWNEPSKHGKWNKPDTKWQILYVSSHTRSSE